MKLPPAMARPVAASVQPLVQRTVRAGWPDRYLMAGTALFLVFAATGLLALVMVKQGQISSVKSTQATATATNDPLAANPFTCGGSTGLGSSAAPALAYLDSVHVTQHKGFDRVVIGFANGRPANVVLATQPNARFQPDIRGPSVLLSGSTGALLTISPSDGHTRYRAPSDIKPASPAVLEMRQIRDSGATVQWAIGLRAKSCYRIAFIDNPTTLLIDFQTATAATGKSS